MTGVPALLQAGRRLLANPHWSRALAVGMGRKAMSTVGQQHFKPETRVTTLPSGLRVATENTGHATCTVGLWIDAGSRFETDETNGVAHFLEHMAFKGTTSRTREELELEVEDMGGHLNAFTSREMTAYYAKVVGEDTERGINILADILQNSTFPDVLLENERNVIMRELQEVETQMNEVVYDCLHAIAFEGNELARTILGPPKNIMKITKTMIKDYITTNYTAPRIVVAAAGGVDHDKLVSLSEKYFSKFSPNKHTPPMRTPAFIPGYLKHVDKTMPLAHVGLAFRGVGWAHPYYYPLMIASTIIGSWNRSFGGASSLSSPMARAIGSKELAHSYLAFTTCYHDTGLWGVYLTCEGHTIPDLVKEVEKEFARLALAATPEEVERAKIQMKTTAIMSLDGTTPVCEDIGRQMLTLGRRMPVDEVNARIDAVTHDMVKQVLRELVYDQCPAVVGIGPVANLPDPQTLRAGAHWLTF
eukprot:comp20149_c0_seq1/m.24920 comp20149_c0_seq1/g.24920  ORF comp20149_c0_seq1/g.24920 comp20149_c0_seq1/m.24920 type:complete len:475 (-) comp20149_c0_seq1:309-1733(-)